MNAQAERPRDEFVSSLGFTPDRFQLEAFTHIDNGDHVVVAAPTGSGKTLVAMYAVERSVSQQTRIFYTTPIKALSNQKYAELVARFGAVRVGLLTGDNSINPEADVVVMTTEVLRNMLYSGKVLDALSSVVLDEVHYLQDAYRGSVWEEVIIHLPQHVKLVCLSATVSNATELNEWIETVRGPSGLVVETERPVRLENTFMVGSRSGGQLHLMATIKAGKANPKGFRYELDPRQLKRRGRGNKGRGRIDRKWRTPTRGEVVDELSQRGLLPAIYFIFSRAACDDAARSIYASGANLTSGDERVRIAKIVEDKLAGLDRAERNILGYDWFVEALKAGVAPHHAGMVPPFKEAVETCFEQGLLKVVFATETLALGVNMPARTVVLEKLTKFTGEGHEMLTPSQYTQLTGRAGRRSIDTAGTAVVLWSPFVRFGQVADLALSRHFELTSSFRPTYNMAANMVRRFDPVEARQLLNLSFAQFRTDAGVVRSEERVKRLEQRQYQLRRRFEREYGPIDEIHAALDNAVVEGPDVEAIAFALTGLKPGDVIGVDDHVADPSLVLAVAVRSKGRVVVKTTNRHGDIVDLVPRSLNSPPIMLGNLELPDPYLPNSVTFVHEASQMLARSRFLAVGEGKRVNTNGSIRTANDVPAAARKAIRRMARIEKDLGRARGLNGSGGRSLAARFDRIVALLSERSHVELGDDPTTGTKWRLTPTGQRLARIYHESDLLVVEALAEGLFEGLNPAELAALVSCFVYEDRTSRSGPGGGRQADEPWFPSTRLKRQYRRLEDLHSKLNEAEHEADLPLTSRPDPGMIPVAHAWAAGGELWQVLESEVISPGDFVRLTKQLVDLLRQIANLAPNPVGPVARKATQAVFRDLVSASSLSVELVDETENADPDDLVGGEQAEYGGYDDTAR